MGKRIDSWMATEENGDQFPPFNVPVLSVASQLFEYTVKIGQMISKQRNPDRRSPRPFLSLWSSRPPAAAIVSLRPIINIIMAFLNSGRVFGILTAILIALNVFALVLMPIFYGRSESINGYTDERFVEIRHLFHKNFLEGYERSGGALAVYYKGKEVVNLWGGMADSNRKWKSNSRSLMFSATKGLSSLCIAVLVDRGYIQWEDKVSTFWPEFAKNGKENITVEQILTHQAGLPYLSEPLLYDDLLFGDGILRKLENATPHWEPGKGHGYHALTFGWLLDGIVRHSDPKGRDIATFVKEELSIPYGLDISIGVESEKKFAENAAVTSPDIFEYIRDTIIDWRMLIMFAAYYGPMRPSAASHMMKSPEWLHLDDIATFNEYRIQRLPIAAANGLSSASDLARLFALSLNGTILSQKTVQSLKTPTFDRFEFDRTVVFPLLKGHGFFYEPHPIRANKYIFGHPGYGCQGLHVDPEEELVIVYLSNGLKTATSLLCWPYQRILRQLYSTL